MAPQLGVVLLIWASAGHFTTLAYRLKAGGALVSMDCMRARVNAALRARSARPTARSQRRDRTKVVCSWVPACAMDVGLWVCRVCFGGTAQFCLHVGMRGVA